MALKRIGTLLMWIILFCFAISVLAFAPFAFVYNLFNLFWKSKIGTGIDKLNKELKTTNYTLDVLGNVTLFNWIDNHQDRHPYGISGETISEVLYHREKQGKLTWFDAVIYKGIIIFDPPHFKIFEK